MPSSCCWIWSEYCGIRVANWTMPTMAAANRPTTIANTVRNTASDATPRDAPCRISQPRIGFTVIVSTNAMNTGPMMSGIARMPGDHHHTARQPQHDDQRTGHPVPRPAAGPARRRNTVSRQRAVTVGRHDSAAQRVIDVGRCAAATGCSEGMAWAPLVLRGFGTSLLGRVRVAGWTSLRAD